MLTQTAERQELQRVIDTWPDNRVAALLGFVKSLQPNAEEYDNDTDYLMSIPGMADKIKAGLNTPLADCVPLSEVWPDV